MAVEKAMNEQEIIQSTYRLGHFWGPENPDGVNVSWNDLGKLKLSDSVVKDALRSRSRMQVTDYAPECFRAHGRAPDFDGLPGPAMDAMLDAERCPVPDYRPPAGAEGHFDDPELEEIWTHWRDAEPAIGVGNWKGCHNVGNFHSASVHIDRSGIGSHLQPVFKEVLANVRKSYAEIGLLWRFIEDGKDIVTGERFEGVYNTRFSFRRSLNGAIGLAIVGTNETCQSQIWCRYLSSYRPSNTVREWTTLVKHELGHNCGRGHTGGGVMNPSIVSGLPTMWPASDPSYSWLRREFGGEPVDGGDTPTPPQPDTIEQRVAHLEKLAAENQMKDLIQDIKLQYFRNLLDQRGG
jgi:hypothetical protein